MGLSPLKAQKRGAWVPQSVKHLPLAPYLTWGPGIEPCIGLPAQQGVCFSLSPCLSALLVLSQINFLKGLEENYTVIKDYTYKIKMDGFLNKCIFRGYLPELGPNKRSYEISSKTNCWLNHCTYIQQSNTLTCQRKWTKDLVLIGQHHGNKWQG